MLLTFGEGGWGSLNIKCLVKVIFLFLLVELWFDLGFDYNFNNLVGLFVKILFFGGEIGRVFSMKW